MYHRHIRRGCTAAAFAAATLLAACDRDRTPTGITPQDGPRLQMQYDYTDTYLSVDMDVRTHTTITTDQSFPDPHTGQPTTSLTVASPTDELSLTGGYNSYGDFVGELHHPLDPEVEPGTRVATTTFEWGRSANFDEYGNRMPDVLPDGTPAPVISAEEYLPPEGEPVTSGVVVDEVANFYGGGGGGGEGGGDGGTYCEPSALVCPVRPPEMYSTAPGGVQHRRRVEQPDAGTVLVIDEMDAEAGIAGLAAVRADEAQPTGRTRATRTYRKQNGKYILTEVRLQRDEVSGASRARHVQTIRYKKVTWRRNPERDRARADKARQRAATPAPAPTVLRATPPPAGRGGIPLSARPYGQPGAARAALAAPAAQPNAMASSSGGARIVLQHGFAQSANYYTWSPADRDIQGRLAAERPLVTETDYGARFEAQAAIWTIPQIEQR